MTVHWWVIMTIKPTSVHKHTWSIYTTDVVGLQKLWPFSERCLPTDILQRKLKLIPKTDWKEIKTIFVICTLKNTNLKMSTVAGRNMYEAYDLYSAITLMVEFQIYFLGCD